MKTRKYIIDYMTDYPGHVIRMGVEAVHAGEAAMAVSRFFRDDKMPEGVEYPVFIDRFEANFGAHRFRVAEILPADAPWPESSAGMIPPPPQHGSAVRSGGA